MGNGYFQNRLEGSRRCTDILQKSAQAMDNKAFKRFLFGRILCQKIGLRDSDKCPRCNNVETTEHVWQCQDESANQIWATQMRKLQIFLGQLQTNPSIITAILKGLDGWRNGIDQKFSSRFQAEAIAILQEEMGWKHFFEGRHHTQWRVLQSKYYKDINCR
jgi:hypothetical protein